MDNHVKLVGLGNMAYGALGVVIGALMFFGFGAAGLFSGSLVAGLTLGTVGLIAGAAVAVMSLPRIIGGLGLLAKRNWARYVLTITSAIGLFEFPVGTALSGYSLWVLHHNDTKRLMAPRY